MLHRQCQVSFYCMSWYSVCRLNAGSIDFDAIGFIGPAKKHSSFPESFRTSFVDSSNTVTPIRFFERSRCRDLAAENAENSFSTAWNRIDAGGAAGCLCGDPLAFELPTNLWASQPWREPASGWRHLVLPAKADRCALSTVPHPSQHPPHCRLQGAGVPTGRSQAPILDATMPLKFRTHVEVWGSQILRPSSYCWKFGAGNLDGRVTKGLSIGDFQWGQSLAMCFDCWIAGYQSLSVTVYLSCIMPWYR